MKRMFTVFQAAMACVLFLVAACSLPEGVDKQALADAALAQVVALNEQGVDPINLGPSELALLSSGCAFVPVVYPERADDITAICTVIVEAAK